MHDLLGPVCGRPAGQTVLWTASSRSVSGTLMAMVKRVISMMLIALLTTTGCTVSFNGDTDTGHDKTPHAKAPTDDNGVEVWDLRTRPTAQDVGMPTSEDYVAYGTDEPRTVRFLLPEGKVLETKLYLLVFDRVTAPATTDKTVVTGMDFHARSMPAKDAYKVMGRSLKAFGLGTAPVDQWRQEIENRPTDGYRANMPIEGGDGATIGYLDIGVTGDYNPVDGDNTASLRYRIDFHD